MSTFPEIEVGYGIFLDSPGINLKGYLKTLIAYVRMSLQLYRQGGVHLGWIRIEPHTALHRQAVEQRIIPADAELLPEDEKDFAKLFYVHPSLRYLDACVLSLLNFVDYIVKPSVTFLFRRLLGKGKKPPKIQESF